MEKTSILLPEDVVVSENLSLTAKAMIKPIHEVATNEMILDIGPKTAEAWAKWIAKAKTIVWNGPVGVFESPNFAKGTEAIAKAIATSSAFSLAGGGDTIAAIEQFGVASDISYISTGGGAFLECLEGKTLPAVAALNK
jgi:phosphoglycerate kinase